MLERLGKVGLRAGSFLVGVASPPADLASMKGLLEVDTCMR
jgi:hypothetical protein